MNILFAIACFVSVGFSLPQSDARSLIQRSASRTSPPVGAIVVDNSATRTNSSYQTVQSGVNALTTNSTTPQTLFIMPGTYTEQVYIPALNSNLTVQGYTTDATSYENNTVDITFNLALINTTSDDLTATVRQWNKNTKFYNLNIHNTFGHINTDGIYPLAKKAMLHKTSIPMNLSLTNPRSKPRHLRPHHQPRLLRLSIHRLPRHRPCQQRLPTLR